MNKKVALEKLTWKALRKRVQKVNPRLAQLIDKLDPDDSYTLFLAKYPYGSNILVDGRLYLPTANGGSIAFEDPAVGPDIQHQLNYVMGTNPMTLVLSNTVELFISVEDRIIPYKLIEPGAIFGTWGIIEYFNQTTFFTFKTLWDMTAGARSIFLLPKISDVSAFNKIQKKFDIKSDVPKRLIDQWSIFTDIANNSNFTQPWEVELIYFSRKWADSMHDPAWQEFNSYVYNLAWRASEFWRSQFCWDLTFSRIQAKRNIKPCPYVADIASHLLATSVGAVSALKPLIDNTAAPIDGLRKVFEEDYNISYAPIFIGPANFNILAKEKVSSYFSFHYPTAVKMSQKSSARSSLINDMYQIRSLLNKYLDEINTSDFKIEGTAIYEMAKKIKFTFCHYQSDGDTKMAASNQIILTDESFQVALSKCNVQQPPKNAPFLNGCVQISQKDEDSN